MLWRILYFQRTAPSFGLWKHSLKFNFSEVAQNSHFEIRADLLKSLTKQYRNTIQSDDLSPEVKHSESNLLEYPGTNGTLKEPPNRSNPRFRVWECFPKYLSWNESNLTVIFTGNGFSSNQETYHAWKHQNHRFEQNWAWKSYFRSHSQPIWSDFKTFALISKCSYFIINLTLYKKPWSGNSERLSIKKLH